MLTTRIGDTAFGICFWPPPPVGPGPLPSIGIVVSGNPLELNSGLPTSSLGDIVVFPCGMGIIAGGSVQDLNAGLPTSNLMKPVIGPLVQASIVSGDPLKLTL